MSGRRAVIAGSSGLVGSCLLRGLLKDEAVTEVHAVCRSDLGIRHPKLTIHMVNFKAMPLLPPVDEIYLALGTTIRQAGSRAAFRAVDLEANLAVARAGVLAGARRLGLVSAMSASARSLLFYNRVKGELEDALEALPLASLSIARPSFLLGDRKVIGQPARYGERLGIGLSRLLEPLLPVNYRLVEARRVAQSLLATVPVTPGRRVLLSGEIQGFG